MKRLFALVVLAALALPAAAQPVVPYNGLDGDRYDDARPGVRVGLGLGPYVYLGPDILTGPGVQDDVVATNLALTAEVSFPLSGNLYGRVLGGLLNVGADNDRPDLPLGAEQNPFLTRQTLLAEAHVLYYVSRPGAGQLAPYVFTGLSGLFATGDAAPGVGTAALALPVGLGVEYGVTRDVALFAEGSFRFGLTEVDGFSASARAGLSGADVCDAAGPDYNYEKCKLAGREPYCSNGGALPDCREVGDRSDADADGRFNSVLALAGVRLGFGGAPARPYIPEPEVVYVPAPQPVLLPEPAPLVCDLVELNAVYFDYGSSSLDRRSRALLDENIELLLSDPACCVFLDGYTDTAEGDRFGMGLAGRRAQAVYDYYLGAGVSASRLQIRNRGVAAPACDKEDAGPGCERNRRVESLPVDCERFRFLLDDPSYDGY